MATLALNSAGDLDVDASGRLTVLTGGDEVATRLRSRFRLVRGEWFLDTSQGLPWYGSILGVKNPNMKIVRQILTDVILECPGVKSLDALDVSLDRTTRTLNVTFAVTADDGSTITADALDAPYTVTAV